MDCSFGTIDLHIHSTASDGSLKPAEILEQAVKKGLSAISITDHDTVAGVGQALRHGIPDAIEFIEGIEISAAYPPPFDNTASLHILGYGIRIDHPELLRMLEAQRAARSGRNPLIIEKLNAMGVPATMGAVAAATGKDIDALARPHIAEFLVISGYAADIDDAFDRFLGRGKPAYVDKYRIPAEKAISLIRAAGGIAVLAHPALLSEARLSERDGDGLKDPSDNRFESILETLIALGLGGIEAYYPGQTYEQTVFFVEAARKKGLLVTGGTDFHGDINPDIEMGSGRGDLSVPYAVFKDLKNALSMDNSTARLEASLFYRFSRAELLETALCHRSYAFEQAKKTDDNEKLEFLGDAVLNLVISHILMDRFPALNEGELSRMRASLVNTNRLAAVARSIDLGDFVHLGKGESKSKGSKKKSILADAFEALMAAVYLDGGYRKAFDVIERLFSEHFNTFEKTPPLYDYKSLLQEMVQNRFHQVTEYTVAGAEGPDHDKTFHVVLDVCDIQTEGFGKSKKAAEQDAARKAFEALSDAGNNEAADQ